MPANDPTMKKRGETDGEVLGLAPLAGTLAGGQGFTSGTHARLGIYARWTCDGCTSTQFTGRYPCKDCTGYTASNKKVVRGVLTAHGKLNARCPR